jgi:hypothetical protein
MEPNVEQPTVTMTEVLEEMRRAECSAKVFLEKSNLVANLNLKDDNTKECTYNQGYKNQTVFGCFTCNKRAGMCLGCYINCHQDHETFEIGLKRNFRCDCGTNAFGDSIVDTLF